MVGVDDFPEVVTQVTADGVIEKYYDDLGIPFWTIGGQGLESLVAGREGWVARIVVTLREPAPPEPSSDALRDYWARLRAREIPADAPEEDL